MAGTAQAPRKPRSKSSNRKPPAQPRRVRRWFTERIDYGQNVDRDAGIIRHVKVLGLVSVNGRRYLPEALREATALYEGISVRTNHPKNPDDHREVEDVFGWLKDVVIESDGMYADLHFIKEHKMAPLVCEAAERNPKLFGFSHNAQGEGEEDQRGEFIVHRITEVRSVDLVADPATNTSLFEGRRAVKKILVRKWLKESLYPKIKPAHKRLKARAKKLLEAMGDEYAAEMDEPAEPKATAEDGLNSALHAILDDDALSNDERLVRIRDLLKLKDKHAGTEEEEEEDETDVEEEEEDEEEEEEEVEEGAVGDQPKTPPGTIKESKLRSRLARLERKDRARDLCEAAGLRIGPNDRVFLEALVRCPDDKSMKALIDREKGKPAAAARGQRPRSSAGDDNKVSRHIPEAASVTVTMGEQEMGLEEQMSFLRGGSR